MKTSAAPILVVTPTLGDSPFLEETVATVRAQSGPVQHMISTPAGKVAAMKARFPHAKVCADQGRTGGIYGALNAGIAAAESNWEWFTYINDDDVLRPEFSVMHAAETAAETRADVAYGDVELIDEGGAPISRITIERSPEWIPALLQDHISPLMQQGMLFRRATVERLRRFDTRYRLCADLDFWLRAYVAGARFRSHPLRVAQFRLRRGQLSGNTSITAFEQAEIVERHLPREIPPAVRRVARWRYRWCNLPRYLARIRNRGLQSSYEVLETAEARR
jgi:GT2 family glycosyltransferase